jgi:hypothetical protein
MGHLGSVVIAAAVTLNRSIDGSKDADMRMPRGGDVGFERVSDQ